MMRVNGVLQESAILSKYMQDVKELDEINQCIEDLDIDAVGLLSSQIVTRSCSYGNTAAVTVDIRTGEVFARTIYQGTTDSAEPFYIDLYRTSELLDLVAPDILDDDELEGYDESQDIEDYVTALNKDSYAERERDAIEFYVTEEVHNQDWREAVTDFYKLN